MGQMMIFVKRMFWGKFYMELSVFSCLEMFRQTLGSNLGIGKSKLGFWGENGVFPERNLSQLAMASNVYSQWRATCSQLRAVQCRPPVFAFSCLFTRFCFELVFGENMNIVENIFIFLRALV
jgi:hypothetical protein